MEEKISNIKALNTIEEFINLIENNQAKSIDVIKVKELSDNINNLTSDKLYAKCIKGLANIVDLFVNTPEKINKDTLDIVMTDLENMRQEINKVELEAQNRRHTAEVKKSLDNRERQHVADYESKQNETFLRHVKNSMGERVYSDKDLSEMSGSELASLKEEIYSRLTSTEIKEIEREIEKEKIQPSRHDMVDKSENLNSKIEDTNINNDSLDKEQRTADIDPETETIEDERDVSEEFDKEHPMIETKEELAEEKEAAIDIDALTQEFENVAEEVKKYIENSNSKLNSANLHKNRLEEERAEVLKNEPNNKALIEEYNKKINEQEEIIRKIKSPTKEEQIKDREEKDILYRTIETKKRVLSSYIEKLEAENRKLEFEVNEMSYNAIMDYKEWNEKKNRINNNKSKIEKMTELLAKYAEIKEELGKTEKTYDFNEIKKIGEDPIEKDIDLDDIGDLNDIESYEKAIEKLKENLLKVPEDKRMDIINKISELVISLYEKDQKEFEKKLSECKTVKDKLERIEKRMDLINNGYYGKYFDSENPDIANILAAEKEKINNSIKASFDKNKEAGEYCFKEYESVASSKEYIEQNIKDETFKLQFNTLVDKMTKIIENPNQEQYNDWKLGMKEFVENQGLDAEKLVPYLTATAKIKDPKLSVDKDFNINGLGLDKDITKTKKRRKVKNKEKADGFFKKHPKLKLLAIGLALALVVGAPSLMMINSALYMALGGGALATAGPVQLTLHSINLALSKFVGFGAFKFTEAGLYTFGGKAGALALYSKVGAMITASLEGLGLGGFGIKKLIDKIKKKNKNKIDKLNKNIPKKEEKEPTEENNKDLDNDKKTVLQNLREVAEKARNIKKNKKSDELIENEEDLELENIEEETKGRSL